MYFFILSFSCKRRWGAIYRHFNGLFARNGTAVAVCLISQEFSMIRISAQSSSAILPFCSIHRDLDHLILAVDIIILQQSSGAAALILCCK